MQRNLESLSPVSLDLEFNPVFNVVIVYEDFESGKQARKTYDYLVENLGTDCQFENQMWKFDVLRIPKLREMAARDAAAADIIIISGHGGSELPADVRHWIEAWQNQSLRAIALVALFDRPHEETGAIRAYLADAARRCNMAFFAQPDDWPGKTGTESPSPSQCHPKSRNTLTSVEEAVQRAAKVSRWELP